MKLLILSIFIFTIFISCSSTHEKVEEQACKDNRDCKIDEICNLETKKCETVIVTPNWSYQSEKFDDIQLPYLFVNKYIDYDNNDNHEGREIRVVGLKNKHYIKPISFPFTPNSPILKNSYNKKFYFYNKLDDYNNDEKYGLMEIDPKTGMIKQVTATYANAKIGAIADNGKVYSVTNKACTHKDYPKVLGTKVSVYNPKDNKESLICIPSIISYLHYNLNGKIYTEGDDEDVYIFEINPNDDSIKEILSGMSAHGGWSPISFMDTDLLYARIPESQVDSDNVLEIDLKTLLTKEVSIKAYKAINPSVNYKAVYGGFSDNKDNLFMFMYNYTLDEVHLVRYDKKTEEVQWLYSDMPYIFKSFYNKDSNSIEIIPGLIFFLDDYSIEQFRGESYKVKEPVKKF